MICIERHVQQIRPDKWGELAALDNKFNAVESRLGFPAKRRWAALANPLFKLHEQDEEG